MCVYVCEVHQDHPHVKQLGACVYCDLVVKCEYGCCSAFENCVDEWVGKIV